MFVVLVFAVYFVSVDCCEYLLAVVHYTGLLRVTSYIHYTKCRELR